MNRFSAAIRRGSASCWLFAVALAWVPQPVSNDGSFQLAEEIDPGSWALCVVRDGVTVTRSGFEVDGTGEPVGVVVELAEPGIRIDGRVVDQVG